MTITKKLKTWLQRSSRAKYRKRRRAAQQLERRDAAIFEMLEPRMLLAADLFAEQDQSAQRASVLGVLDLGHSNGLLHR